MGDAPINWRLSLSIIAIVELVQDPALAPAVVLAALGHGPILKSNEVIKARGSTIVSVSRRCGW